MSKQAMQMALEALELFSEITDFTPAIAVHATTALKQALAEPEQEPVAIVEQLWAIIDDIDTYTDMAKADDKLYRSLVERRQADRWKTGITTDGYTLNIPSCSAPPQRKPLTDEELKRIELGLRKYHDGDRYDLSLHDFARAIERAHGIEEKTNE